MRERTIEKRDRSRETCEAGTDGGFEASEQFHTGYLLLRGGGQRHYLSGDVQEFFYVVYFFSSIIIKVSINQLVVCSI